MTAAPLDEAVLDDEHLLGQADPHGMLRHIATSAAQVRESLGRAGESDLSDVRGAGRPRALVVAGAGPGGLVGDAVTALVGPTTPVPILTVRTGVLPGWVGAADLVLAVSGSGNAEETLTAVTEAARRGCRVAGVGAADSLLARMVEQNRGSYVAVPTEARPARAGWWSLLVPALAVADAAGVLRLSRHDVERAALRLEETAVECRPASESFVNPAKSLALSLAGDLPLIWAGSPVGLVAAARWQSQLAANARYPALAAAVSAVAQDLLGVLDGPLARGGDDGDDDLDDFFRDRVDDAPAGMRPRLVLLRDADEPPAAAARLDAVLSLAQERGVGVHEVRAVGECPVERLASLVGFGDYVSTYLATLYGIDPSTSGIIKDLEQRTRPT